jgi:hypothetical protein
VADLFALVIPAGLATFIVPAVQAVLLGIAAVLGMSSNNPKRRAAARAMVRALVHPRSQRTMSSPPFPATSFRESCACSGPP